MNVVTEMSKSDWIKNVSTPDKKICGCDLRAKCGCDRPPMELTIQDLKELDRGQLFRLYVRTINDEMSPLMWKGFSKRDMIELFVNGQDSVILYPWY